MVLESLISPQKAEKRPAKMIVLGFAFHFLPRGLKYSVKRLTVEASWPVQAFLLASMIWLVFQFRAADIQPFIYFKF